MSSHYAFGNSKRKLIVDGTLVTSSYIYVGGGGENSYSSSFSGFFKSSSVKYINFTRSVIETFLLYCNKLCLLAVSNFDNYQKSCHELLVTMGRPSKFAQPPTRACLFLFPSTDGDGTEEVFELSRHLYRASLWWNRFCLPILTLPRIHCTPRVCIYTYVCMYRERRVKKK